MKEIDIISPIKKPDDIIVFTQKSNCREFYVYHHKFLDDFKYVNEFIQIAHELNSKIYVNFKHNITEEDLVKIKNFIEYLKKTDIDGIFINSFAILEAIKTQSLKFKIIIDSYFDIHNLSGIDFVNMFHKIDKLIITEEIYMKNIAKIKKYTNLNLAIDSDNLPWCAEDIKKLHAIDSVVIKGKFNQSEEILDAIKLVEKILDKPKMFKNQKLPFKHIRKSFYQTNHFSGEMISAEGKDFKFSRNIIKHEWDFQKTNLKKSFDYKSLILPKINLKLSSLAQLKELDKFNKKIGFNPIYSIEYGEIVSTSDLAKSSYNQIINIVKDYCYERKIKFYLSTPRILIERDFDRVFEYVKNLCLYEPHPNSIIINNIGFLWTLINDNDLYKFPIEIGQGIDLLNSMSIMSIYNLTPIQAIDLSTFDDIKNIKNCIKKIKNHIPRRKLTIAGNFRVPSLGLCPLNNDSAIISRLSCKAPCHKGNFALKDPSLNKIFPFAVDGFCRMHMFKDTILGLYSHIKELEKIGINEFALDCNDLEAKILPVLLTNFLNSYAEITSKKFNNSNEYKIEQLYL